MEVKLMGERYLITGVQLGMLIEILKKQRQKTIEKIIDEQFIGESENNVKDDADLIAEMLSTESS